jgi:hypothetical protein
VPPAPTAAVGVNLRRETDQVGELANRVEITASRESLEPEGVQVIAGEQPEVGIGALEQPRCPVVQEISLADGLDQEDVLRPGVDGPWPRSRQGSQRRVFVRLADVRGDHVLAVADQGRQRGK